MIFKILLLFLSVNCEALPDNYMKEIKSEEITRYGVWYGYVHCNEGEYAGGMQSKFSEIHVHSFWSFFNFFDNTGLNAVRLYCQRIGASNSTNGSLNPIMSGEGADGKWGEVKWCPNGTVITGFSLKSVPDRGPFKDDLGATSFRVYCGNPFEGRSTKLLLESDKNEWGTWTGDQFCDKGFAVCGIKSQVEARAKDTTALNNVNLHCCPVSEDVKLTSCTPNLVAIRIDTLDNRRGDTKLVREHLVTKSYTRTNQDTKTLSKEEKTSFYRKIGEEFGFNGGSPVSFNVSGEGGVTLDNVRKKDLISMVQTAVTNTETKLLFDAAPGTVSDVYQLVIQCGGVQLELQKVFQISSKKPGSSSSLLGLSMGATILILLAAAVLLIFLIILSVFLVSRIRVKRDRSKMSRTGEGAKRVSKTKTGTPIKEIGSVKKIRCLKHK